MKKVCVGVDIGGTNSVFGIVDEEGNILKEGSIKTTQYPIVEQYVEALTTEIRHALDSLDGIEFIGTGIGAPNGNYNKGTIEHAANLAWKGIVPLAKMISDKLNKPTMLTNDANAAAIGEMVYGAARYMKNFVMITLGTGLGSGIVVNGELVYGHDGFAGELGHLTIIPEGRKCGCGQLGCLETYVSATGIKRTVFELMADMQTDSILRKVCFNDMDAKMIFEAAQQGDAIALAAFEKTGTYLGRSLADVVACLSPEAIFLFGGLAGAGDLIFKPTQASFEKNLMKIFTLSMPKIQPSQLNGKNIAILGSAALAWKEIK